MITATNLSKRFGDKTAVEAISFELQTGEVLGFLGPNAAGKTTTMRMLTCYFPPSGGTATVAGFDIQKDSIKVRQHIGYLPEHVPIYPEMTAREFIEFAAAAKGVAHLDRKAQVDEALSRCNLNQVQNQLVGTLSRGFRQRVGLAQAIVNKPKVLILDEPTVGLDPAQIRDIRDLIKSLSETSTVILSTHILHEVEAICDRIIIIAEGRIRAIDTVANLNASLQGSTRFHLEVGKAEKNEVVAAITGLDGVRQVRSDLPGQYTVETEKGRDLRAELGRLVVNRQWDLLGLNKEGLTLEDIFLRIIQSSKGEPEVEAGPSVGASAPPPAEEPVTVAESVGVEQ